MDKKLRKNKKVDKNAERVDLLESKLQEMETSWKRALADYKNLEKRTLEEKLLFVEFANKSLMEKLLPVLDNFSMLENHTNDVGIKMSVKELRVVLENSGLRMTEVKPGQEFDPNVMDAVDSGQGEDNKVLEVIRPGYFLKDKLIRPASVKVGRGQKP